MWPHGLDSKRKKQRKNNSYEKRSEEQFQLATVFSFQFCCTPMRSARARTCMAQHPDACVWAKHKCHEAMKPGNCLRVARALELAVSTEQCWPCSRQSPVASRLSATGARHGGPRKKRGQTLRAPNWGQKTLASRKDGGAPIITILHYVILQVISPLTWNFGNSPVSPAVHRVRVHC